MLLFNRRLGYPTTLTEIGSIDWAIIEKIPTAAKNPQPQCKLQNMPVALSADLVGQYLGPVLEAAWSGDLTKIAIQE